MKLTRREDRWLWAIVAAALALRLIQAGLRWDEIALAYAAYQQPFVDALSSGDLGAWAQFHGLHPPLYSLCFALLNGIWGAPAAWLLFSAILSAAAVLVIGRLAGLAAAALLAVDPLQLAYAGEVNNYPLLVFMVAMLLRASEKAQKGEGLRGLVIWGILASWTHFLGGLVLGLCGIRLALRSRKDGLKVLGWVLLGALPVLLRMLQLAGEEGTYGQSGLDWGAVGEGLYSKIGWWWFLVLPAVVGARRRQRELGWMALALFGALIAMLALQIAAPHQQPYWLVLGPFLAILVAANPGPLPWILAGLGLLTVFPNSVDRLRDLRSDLARERAIDVALAEAAPEDSLWLVAPGLQPDDDKSATSDVLWRLSPWGAARPWRGEGFEYVDPRYGQPRIFGGRVVHSSVDIVEGGIEEGCQRTYTSAAAFEEAVDLHLKAGRKVWVVLYDHGPACDMPGGLDWAMRGFQLAELSEDDPSSACRWVGIDRGLGVDRLCLIEGRI